MRRPEVAVAAVAIHRSKVRHIVVYIEVFQHPARNQAAVHPAVQKHYVSVFLIPIQRNIICIFKYYFDYVYDVLRVSVCTWYSIISISDVRFDGPIWIYPMGLYQCTNMVHDTYPFKYFAHMNDNRTTVLICEWYWRAFELMVPRPKSTCSLILLFIINRIFIGIWLQSASVCFSLFLIYSTISNTISSCYEKSASSFLACFARFQLYYMSSSFSS